MTRRMTAHVGARVFDGARMRDGCALLIQGGTFAGLAPFADIPAEARRIDADGGVLAPGYVDLQVNGGGGVMLNDDPSVVTIRRMAEAHGRLGATSILPTLITDTPEKTRAAVDAVAEAVAAGVPGVAGLHLEGPHLSVARKGAHDAGLIRPMGPDDLAAAIDAAHRLPALMMTMAPESVTAEQIRALADAGVIVSLGHSEAGYDDVLSAFEAGARCVTHLFNAMSQLGSRQPGLVGAALGIGGLSAGLIADGIHVHPEAMRIALAAKAGPGRIFLVSDAMAAAGSDIEAFTLNGRRIERRDGRLTLADGTLAGADLDLTTAVRNIQRAGADPASALEMATSSPARLIRAEGRMGLIAAGRDADFVLIDRAGALAGVWRRGEPVAAA